MKFIGVILIIALGFTAYANSLNGKFIRDDEDLIRDNPNIKSWPGVAGYFRGAAAVGGREKWGSYRPLQMLTYASDYSIWKSDVRGYHLTNILLHIAVAVSLYWLANVLFGDGLMALFTGILFVVNPLFTEAVSYISGRADSLAALFMLLGFIFYRFPLRERKAVYILTLACYALALLSRESALVFPALLFLYHYAFKKEFRKEDILSLGGVAGISVIYVLMRFTLLRGLLSDIALKTNLLQRIPGFFVAITDYTRLLLFPVNLHTGYGLPLFKAFDPRALLGMLLAAFFLVVAFRRRRRNTLLFFSVSWFFITLLPQSNLYPINAYMAEHWLYVPSMGFFLVLAQAIRSLYGIKRLKNAALGILIVLTGFYLYLTVKQNDYWREPVAFFERTIKSAPDNYGDYVNLGILYYMIGKQEEAAAQFKKAIKINPAYADAYYNLGRAYYDSGEKKSAISAYEKALTIKPAHPEALNNLGNAYYDAGKKEKALEAYRKAAETRPNYADAYYNLGRTYLSLGDTKGAIRAYERVIEINTGDAEVSYNLAVLYYHEKNFDMALKYCNKAAELGYGVNPNFLKLIRSSERDPFAGIRKEMVEKQIKGRGIKDERVLEAMRKVKRHLFVPKPVCGMAYEDGPLSIGHGQTISQPYIVAYMTEAVMPGPDDRVLEIGTGSGYQAAVLAEVVKEVYTVEILKKLADSARERLEELGYKNIKVRHADGYGGWSEQAPFDAIVVTAAPTEIPEGLAGQLKVGGRMIVPVGSFSQELYLITRTDKGYEKKRLLPVRFVPMVRGG